MFLFLLFWVLVVERRAKRQKPAMFREILLSALSKKCKKICQIFTRCCQKLCRNLWCQSLNDRNTSKKVTRIRKEHLGGRVSEKILKLEIIDTSFISKKKNKGVN